MVQQVLPDGDQAAPASPADLEAALARVALASVQALAPWLAIVFAVFVVTDTLTLPAESLPLIPVWDAALAGALLTATVVLQKGWVPLGRAHAFCGAVMALVLPYLLAVLYATGQLLQTAGLALWQVALGVVLLSTPWTLALLVLSDVLWFATVQSLPDASGWDQYAMLLLGSTVISAVAQRSRRRNHVRLEALLLQERVRHAQLETALRKAREVDGMRAMGEMKNRFINTAAHELANPMTPLVVAAHNLEHSDQSRLDEGQRRSIGLVSRGMRRLELLLRDVLDGARLQAERLPLRMQQRDLARLTREVAAAFDPVAKEAGLRLVVDAPGPLPARVDGARIEQVLTNLLSNAVKFTHQGTVRVTAAREGPQAVIEVQDEGVGIGEPDLEQLFQPFTQLSAGQAVQRGSGLGLYISHGIVNRHGGTLEAHSAGLGKGTTFRVRLPLSA